MRKWLADIRAANGKRQQEVADASSISQSYVRAGSEADCCCFGLRLDAVL